MIPIFRRPSVTGSVCLSATVAAMGMTQGATVIPAAPSGFSTPTQVPNSFPTAGSVTADDAGEKILRGFTVSTSFSGTYNSNVTQSPGGSVAPIKGDFIMGFGGVVSYLSKASSVTFGGTYSGTYNQYLSESDFSGYNQGASGVVNYTGARLTAALTAGVAYDEGSNRNYASAFVKQTSVNTGLTANYRLSRKTSLQGNLGYAFTTASGGNFNDTESFDLGTAALWKYSPLTEIGPGIRYTYRSGSTQTGRTSIGPTVNINYKLSTKVALNSRLGMDFASYEDGGSADPTFSASVGLNYQASRLWGMNLTYYRDTQADPSTAGNFDEISSVRIGYHRKIRRATLNLGMGYDTNRSQGSNGGSNGSDRNYFTSDASLGMAIFSNTTFASIFLRYADQSSNDNNSFDSVQTGFSINRSF